MLIFVYLLSITTGNQVRIAVTDNCYGIPEDKKHLFELFHD
jgi:signal transduction histidine kinase